MVKDVRKNNIDFLKGIAIIAVVLYHMGLLESGYLGVDIFFVIAGFLTVSSIFRRLENNSFSFWSYIKNKIVRLLPMILIASGICLIVGYILWLPDDYENLSESIIASTFFSNNILSRITTKNYWDTVNDFKPLMHMWYLGILMEFYIVVPLLLKAFRFIAIKVKQNTKKVIGGGCGILCVISLILFILPQFGVGDKFYFLQFRFFELGIGGLVGLFLTEIKEHKWVKKKSLLYLSMGLLLITLCVGIFTFDISKIGVETIVIGESQTSSSSLLLSNTVLVLLIVVFTVVVLLLSDESDCFNNNNLLCLIGKRSYSIFVWHQVLLALYRYSISAKITIIFVIGCIIAIALISEISYRVVEQKVKDTKRTIVITVISAVLVCGISGLIFLKAGVVRDVPELGITTANVHRNMHAEYCDRVYKYDTDFSDNGKTNILVIGNSFARDFGNIILESEYDVNLSYIYTLNETYIDRIKQADRVFIFSDKNNVPNYVWENCTCVYGIGTKNFGSNNGNIYSHRFFKNYYSQSISLDEGYRTLNENWKNSWGENYVDMIDPVTNLDGSIMVFTDEKMYISQDCRHLTQGGARFYVKVLELDKFLSK